MNAYTNSPNNLTFKFLLLRKRKKDTKPQKNDTKPQKNDTKREEKITKNLVKKSQSCVFKTSFKLLRRYPNARSCNHCSCRRIHFIATFLRRWRTSRAFRFSTSCRTTSSATSPTNSLSASKPSTSRRTLSLSSIANLSQRALGLSGAT